jgi:hypothetical protein
MKTNGKEVLFLWKILPLCVVAWIAACGTRVHAAPRRIVLPPETAGFEAAAGVEVLMANCLSCHSAEYITTQPPLSRAAWKASLEKMRGKYGARIAAEQEPQLLDYLAKTYGTESAPAR